MDLGLKLERHRWNLQIKGFYADLQDYIYQEYSRAGPQSYTTIDAHIYGGDIKAAVDLGCGFSLDGGVAFQRGRKDSQPDNNDDKDLAQIAPLKARLALQYTGAAFFGAANRGFYGTVEWVYSQAADTIDEEAGEKRLSSWDIMNVRLGFVWKSCTLNAGVDNLFDRTYAVVNSYEWDVIGGTGATPAIVNEPGRFLYATLGWQW